MQIDTRPPRVISVAPELWDQFVEDLDRIAGAAESIGRIAQTFHASDAPPAPHASISADVAGPVESGSPRVWDTSEDAMLNYDADHLVALRADHRADSHDPADCRVCNVLLTRLGAL